MYFINRLLYVSITLKLLSIFLQAEHVETKRLAALKQVPIQDETELEDFMVQIDILAECRHPNVVQLYEAYYFESKLWVRDKEVT